MPFWFALLIFCVCWIIIGTIVFVSYRFMKTEKIPTRWRIILSDKEFTLESLFGLKRVPEEDSQNDSNAKTVVLNGETKKVEDCKEL